MKFFFDNRILLATFLLNVMIVVLLKLIYPDFNLFQLPNFIYFEVVLIVISIFIFGSLYKSAFKEIAKTAIRKNKERSIQQKNKETQQKDLQLALLKDREMYRREFLGNVSHELKTPLFTIQGYILTLIDGAMKDKNIRTNYLRRINKSVDRLIYIVRDLDVLAEIESGNMNLEFQPFNMDDLVKDVFEFLEIKANENGVLLKMSSELKNPAIVIGDRDRLEQVMLNLVSNAIFYSNRDKAFVHISLKDEQDHIKISVADNGQGISEEHLPRVFERFYRTDMGRSREKGGSGLGLAIVKNILEAHKVAIKVNSEIGKGTHFTFSLPKSQY